MQYDTKNEVLSGFKTDTYKKRNVRKVKLKVIQGIPEKYKPLGLKQDTEKHPQTSGRTSSHVHGLDGLASPDW